MQFHHGLDSGHDLVIVIGRQAVFEFGDYRLFRTDFFAYRSAILRSFIDDLEGLSIINLFLYSINDDIQACLIFLHWWF